MSEKLTFQDAVARLVDFWKERGCIQRQPYNVQVGAGTMNPATVLRVLGPEPWNVVYVEPSIRPDDGRFGENPNRMQMHHQLQVILKPDPGNPQELYLDSLRAIGIDPRQHDIRFVEDNWESPALGAWGLGWEVWLDGQEITQFTYFQQSGSTDLDPVCVEITYGLDRIILALQDKNAVWKMDYSEQVLYEDVLLQSEIEHCKYYFDVADVDALREVYDTYERESQRCVEAGLVVPAHDYNLKCSHLFNVLDTRGAIGVTERANFFRRMRKMAKQISELYLEQRMRLEYPLLDREWSLEGSLAPSKPGAGAPVEQTGAQDFVLEIGQEELPADEVTSAVRQLRVNVPALLKELRLEHEGVVVDGTPRRLAVVVKQLAERQTDLVEEKNGPPANRAFDSDGNPTRAAIGFAKKWGLEPSELKVVEDGKKRYVQALVKQEGRPTEEVLAERLAGVVSGLRFKKSMRWNASNTAYSRPLRWFVALFGANVVPFEYAGVHSGRVSRGLRPYDSPLFTVDHAANYLSMLGEQGVVIDSAERRTTILAKCQELAASLGGTIPENEGLLEEITNLVEAPVPFIGRFEERFLALPDDILVAVMRKHQRYYPVIGADGNLINAFIAVRNGDDQHLDTVRHGNEQVIRARFSDAEFFYNSDKDNKLEDFLPQLGTLGFQVKLGTVLDRVHRIEKLTPTIAGKLGLSDDETATANRAATLMKADLASTMVVEMTSLQGIMGGYYAKMSGEPEAVSAAIAEQYNSVSYTRPGLAIALADRIDALVGLTAAGLLPKGANDPFALRRSAIQIIENLVGNEVSVDLRELLANSAELQPIPATESLAKVEAFITGRLEVMLREYGYPASVVRAVLGELAHDPYMAYHTAATLNEATLLDNWTTLLDSYARCVRITRKFDERFTVVPEAIQHEATRALHDTYNEVAARTDGSVAILVGQIEALEPKISAFFDSVLVMDEDETVRNNRLGLLQSIAALADGIADLSQLEGF